MNVNPEIDQDRVFDLVDTFDKYGYVMFPQQRSIYKHLDRETQELTILEAGCGNGVGTALLSKRYYPNSDLPYFFTTGIVGTDKLQRNVDFATALYPWIVFTTWDINEPTSLWADAVVCVETIEHVANPRDAIKNLISAARRDVWISAPNGTGKDHPPSNPYHVSEYTPKEMLEMIGNHKTTILDWETFSPVEPDSLVDPLVYHIEV